MIKEKRSVDLNARIIDVEYEIKSNDNIKTVVLSFKNLNYGTINAIKFSFRATDSFGDVITFDDGERYEVKRADLNVKPRDKVNICVEIGKYDIKNIDLKLEQIVYSSGEVFKTEEPDIVEYDIEKLSGSWDTNDHFEHDALGILREFNSNAICMPAIHPRGWVCCCGYLNANDTEICYNCTSGKEIQFRKYTKEDLKSEIEKREKKKAEELAEQKKRQEIEEEANARKRKKRFFALTAMGIIALVTCVSMMIYNNFKYGLSKEESLVHEIAQSNYEKIEYFCLTLSLDFSDKCNGYYEDDYNRRSDRSDDVEKDKDFLYSRGIYEASSLLYDLILDQYPEKYRPIYTDLVKTHIGEIFNDISINETLYVKNMSASSYIDKRKEIDETIESLEKYMEKTVLNPTKVDYTLPSIPDADYSNVYGISMGIIYYDDGNIMYIGEMSEGKPDGFGRAWYSSKDGNGTMCEGVFENGIFISGDHYGTDGNSNDIKDVQNVSIEGEFEMVTGLNNTDTSESVANKRVDDEKKDKEKASACAKQYVNTLVNKDNGCNKIEWYNIPSVSGLYYSYSCTVTLSDNSTKKGTITVKKEPDGGFSAVGLDLE